MLSTSDVQAAVNPLRFIFWGGIIWIVDISFTSTTNGVGFRCDILDDTVGTLLIAYGLFNLSRAPIDLAYDRIMLFLKVVIVASVFSTGIDHFIFERPTVLSFALSLLNLAQLVGTVLFCLAMKWFCRSASLFTVARSWHTTMVLFIAIYLVPMGLFYLCSLLAMLTGSSFNVDLGVAGLLLIPLFVWPLIHLFVSTSRMLRAADAGLAEPDPAARGFPEGNPNDAFFNDRE